MRQEVVQDTQTHDLGEPSKISPLAYALAPLRETHDWFASLHFLQGFSSGFSGSGFHVSHGISARSSEVKFSALSGQKAFQG